MPYKLFGKAIVAALRDFGERPAFTRMSQNSFGLGTFSSNFIVIMTLLLIHMKHTFYNCINKQFDDNSDKHV